MLARRTLVTTKVVEVLRAARQAVIFMPARHDHWRVQTGDGYAAYVAGQVCGASIGVTTDEQASWWGGKGVGTVPHSLIAAYGGDTVLAARKFADCAPADINITVLVDFDNTRSRPRSPSPASSGRACGACGSTPPSRSSTRRCGTSWATSSRPASTSGSCGRCAPRSTREGFEHVRIVASGGFTAEKIRAFEEQGVPVDAYGVGSSLIRGANDFTADIVMTDGEPSAKVGRRVRPNERLERVT